MRADGAQPVAVDTFAHYYERLASGEAGLLREDEIEPVAEVPAFEDLPEPSDEEARAALDQAVVLKLNGGLGTGMGMTKAKSLLEVKDGLSFLDVIVRQVLALRASSGARVPLVLMNSFATREDSLAALRRHDGVEADVPLDFVQNRVPKILDDESLAPVDVGGRTPSRSGRRPATATSTRRWSRAGCSRRCSTRGYRYAFVSNSDNLGATLDPRILALARARGGPVPHGGRGAHRAGPQGRPPRAARAAAGSCCARSRRRPRRTPTAFQDISRHRFFNTNTLWVDLRALRAALDANGGVLPLPMIVNRKTVDPADKSSPAVIQLESAMARGDRRLRGRAGAAGAEVALRAGQDDGRPARSCAPTPTR